MGFRRFGGDGQPQAGARKLTGGTGAVEPIEDPTKIFVVETRTVVSHADAPVVCRDFEGCGGGIKLGGVGEHIVDRPGDLQPPSTNGERGTGQLDAASGSPLETIDGALCEFKEINVDHRIVGRGVRGEDEQFIGERREFAQFRVHFAKDGEAVFRCQVGIFREHIDVRSQRRERRP